MKFVKLFENWMEDEDNDQTAYVDAPIAHAGMHVGDEEMSPEDDYDENTPPDDRNPEMDDYDEDTPPDGIGYDDSEVEEEEEAENEEE